MVFTVTLKAFLYIAYCGHRGKVKGCFNSLTQALGITGSFMMLVQQYQLLGAKAAVGNSRPRRPVSCRF